MVALDVIRSAAGVDDNRKKIVQPRYQPRAELLVVLLLALGEKSIRGNHLDVLVVPSSHENLLRVGQLEA